MKEVKITRMSIDHFRGYRNKTIFDLSKGSNFILLSGSNGYGKTSFFDAVEWVFTGKLFRYDESNEEKSKSHFINYQPYESPAVVSIELKTKDSTYILTRTAVNFEGTGTDYGPRKSVIRLSDGTKRYYENEAILKLDELLIADEWKGKIEFQNVFTQFHILTQDKLKFFIQGLKGPARYSQISNLLGTSRFKDYGVKIKEIKSDIMANVSKLNEEILKIKENIDFVNRRINLNQSMPLDGHDKISGFLKSSIDTYNSYLKQINKDVIDLGIIPNNLDGMRNIIKRFENEVNNSLKELHIQSNSLKISLNKIEELRSQKETYLLNKNNLIKLAKFAPLRREQKNLDYINYNWVQYIEFSNKEINLKLKIESVKQKSQELLNENNSLENTSIIIKESLSRLNSCRFADDNLINNALDVITIFDYIKSTEAFNKNLLKEKAVISEELIAKLYAIVESEILSLRETYREKDESSKKIEMLSKDIESINKLDETYLDLLNMAKSFIVNHSNNHQANGAINCPVCDSEYDQNKLINRINEKLTSGNDLLEKKVSELTTVEKLFNEMKKIIENKRITLLDVKSKLRLVLETVSEFLKNESLNCKQEINKYNMKIQEYETELNNLHSQNINISRIIAFYKLPSNTEELSAYLPKRLQDIGDEINQIDPANILEELNEQTIKSSINLVDQKLEELNISDFDSGFSTYHASLKKDMSFLNEMVSQLQLLISKIKDLQGNLDKNVDFQELHRLNDIKKKKNELLRGETTLLNKIGNMHTAVELIVERMNNQILSDNEVLINNIYKRIYPHPLYTNIKLEIKPNNLGNNTLQIKCYKDNDESLEVNPTFTFSTAQMNVVAISIFLALALRQQCTNLRTILLDDPIQSMDDINILSFIDILRSMGIDQNSFEKQLVLSTHDEKIYRLLSKKLRFLNTQEFRYVDYNSDGPVVEEVNNNILI